jgi:ABC-2 type transport system permease protein
MTLPENSLTLIPLILVGVSLIAPILTLLFSGQVRAVFKRELLQYFNSPIAYAIAFAIVLFLSILFTGNLSQFNGQATANDLNNTPLVLAFLLFLVAPLLTMRLLAEENREGTIETLMTLPMNESAFIIGKFLAVWTYYTVLVLLTVSYYGVLVYQAGTDAIDMGRTFGVYYGVWLYGGAVLALTLIWSAITEDQLVAGFLGATTVLIFYLADLAAEWASNLSLGNADLTTNLANGIRELGLTSHYQDTLAQGLVRAEDVLYFLFLIVAALFITTRLVEVRRWRA